MRKALKNRNLNERPIARTLLAFSLIASLAAFGCTTNRTHGAGEPYTGTPSVGPNSPTSNTSGASVPTTPPPMTSSYRGNEQALAPVRPTMHRLNADEAALTMADHLPRVRILGPASPSAGSRTSESAKVAQQRYTVAALNPQYTINNTINSPQAPALNTAAGNGNVRVTNESGKVVVTNVKPY